VVARVRGKNVAIGNRKLMAREKIVLNKNVEETLSRLEGEGKTVVILAVGGKVVGVIAVADTLKEHSREAVQKLREMGLEVVMITGDNARSAKAVARQVGIDRVLVEVLPQDKEKEIKRLQGEGKRVAAVGDGINDAPMLAQADVGIAIGSGTDVAIETGEVVLVKDDLRDVVTAIHLSKYAMRKIKENLFWAFVYNVVSVPLAAGVLYPFAGILVNPVIAGAAMAFSSVSVATNANLMKFYKPPLKSERGEKKFGIEKEEKKEAEEMAEMVETVKDQVCGMMINPTTAKFKIEKSGKTYYFCSKQCFEKFKKRK